MVHLSHDMEAIGRLFSPSEALDAARERRDRTYDPELADLFAAHGSSWFERLGKMEPWDAVLGLEPDPHRTLEGAELDEALTVMADFIDLKSPYMAGHIQHVYTKIGVSTRAADALWAMQHAVVR